MTTTRLARGIRLDGPVGDLLDTLRCISLALPPHCVFVGRTAALARCLWVPPGPHRIEIAHTANGRGRAMSRTTRVEFAGSRRELTEVDVVEVEGVRMTSPARTWLDLAPRLRPVELVALGDSVLRTGVTEPELTDLVTRNRGRRGIRAARAALPMLDRRSRSRPESHMRVELQVPGWPRFEPNQAIRNEHGGWLAEPDLHNARYRVALEYQGGDHAGVERMRRDLTRATGVTGEQWQIHSFGPAEVFTHPERLRLAVRNMLVLGGWRAGAARW